MQDSPIARVLSFVCVCVRACVRACVDVVCVRVCAIVSTALAKINQVEKWHV